MLRFVSSGCARRGSQRAHPPPARVAAVGRKWVARTGEQVVNGSMEMRLFRNARRVWETGLDGKKRCVEGGHPEMCKNAYIAILNVKDFNFCSQ